MLSLVARAPKRRQLVAQSSLGPWELALCHALDWPSAYAPELPLPVLQESPARIGATRWVAAAQATGEVVRATEDSLAAPTLAGSTTNMSAAPATAQAEAKANT